MLPKLNGYEVCGELRKESNVPIIMLTALGNISDRIMGLEFGADDYIIKPFSPKELEARIRAVLRRTAITVENGKLNSKKQIQIKNLLIDLHKRQIFLKGRQIHLTGLEFNLLELLLDNAGYLLSRTYILSIIWGYIPERYVDTRVVDVHISKLRSKLEDDPSNPALILTVRGNGYMFQTF
uniref:ompR n=1 Tax=Ochrosphaera neapolitana TaxID=35137 RepID=UPI00286AE734|nr:ompR [Ochrosphaera neapolitana]WKK50100.1 ompR [Ochrosphaera neapolitana]